MGSAPGGRSPLLSVLRSVKWGHTLVRARWGWLGCNDLSTESRPPGRGANGFDRGQPFLFRSLAFPAASPGSALEHTLPSSAALASPGRRFSLMRALGSHGGLALRPEKAPAGSAGSLVSAAPRCAPAFGAQARGRPLSQRRAKTHGGREAGQGGGSPARRGGAAGEHKRTRTRGPGLILGERGGAGAL